MRVSRRLFLQSLTIPAWATAGLTDRLAMVTDMPEPPRVSPVLRGVNLSGAEFTPDAAHLPGIVDHDYMYPTAADLAHVGSRGHRMVRLPVRWERLQPVLGAPLSTVELGRLVEVIEHADRRGIKVLVDLHNYARYIRSTSEGGATLVLGDGRLTATHLADLWTRLARALRSQAAVLGYGLMNEPHDLPATGGAAPGGNTVWGFDAGLQGWVGEADAVISSSRTSATVHDGRRSLRVGRRLAAGRHQVIRTNDNAQNTLTPSAGGTLSALVLVPALAPGTEWSAQLEMQDQAYRWHAGPRTAMTPGRWSSISCTPDQATWSGHRGVGVQFTCDQSRSTWAEAYVDTVQQLRSPSGRPPEAESWEQASQVCVDAIRAEGDNTAVYVSGVGYSGAQNWARNHPAPWIDDPADAVVYEAHYYFDSDNSGTYRQSYATEDAQARLRGHASLGHRAIAELGVFLDWCGSHGVQGFVGEVGWENSRDTADWNAVGDALYAAMDRAGVGASYWAAGQWFGTNYNLSLYTGAPLSRSTAPATVVEAHPSLNL